jgi:TonB-dependent starch-binding outer membrane protein SusC
MSKSSDRDRFVAPPNNMRRLVGAPHNHALPAAVRAARHVSHRRNTMRWANRLSLVALLVLPGASLLAQAAPAGRITGTVTDSASAQPLTSATVLVVGTTIGTMTGADGRYTLVNVPAGERRVRVQRIGYAPQERAVTVTAGQASTVDFRVNVQAVQLAQVVSIGYGTTERRDVTGSVSSVSMTANETAPIATVDQLLAGTSPGVQVTTSSGEPGGALSVRIRGTSSITGNSEPLYVIDGFPIENDMASSVQGTGGRARTTPPNPLATLNPNDIESISILKDASSTAIYGARGANGVVIITTKQGRGTKPQFGLDYYAGYQQVGKKYDMLNAAEYMDYANAFAQNSNPSFTPFDSATRANILKSGIDTDWQDEIFRTGGIKNLQLSLRGATTAASPTRYALSGGVFDQEGIVVGSGLRRLSGRVNLNQAYGSRFEFGGQLTASQVRSKATPTSGQQNSGAGAVSAAIQYVPILPVKRADGTYTYIKPDLNFYNPQLDAPETPNPVSLAEEVNDSLSDTRFLGNVFGQVELLSGLQFRTSFGADYADRWRHTYYPRTTLRGEQAGGDAIRSGGATTSWLNENTLTYRREVNQNHRFDLLAGYTRQATDVDRESMSNAQFVTDATSYFDIGAGTQEGGPGISSGRTHQALESWLGRANYSLLDRYLFTVTYRTDGSSRFAKGHQWGSFPSAAFAWRASSEPFLRNFEKLDELKFRVSYGVVGNPSVRPYQSLARLNDQGYSFGGTPYAGYYTASVANPDLTWESTAQLDYGVDLAFLDRFNLTADYYTKRTTDLLLNVSVSPELGYLTALANRGEVENKGFELGLDANIIKPGNKSGFSWRANANYATNRNRVTDLGGQQQIFAEVITSDYNLPGSMIQVGKPVGVFYGFKSAGIIRSAEEAAEYSRFVKNFNGSPFRAGDMKILDIAGAADGGPDGLITLADRTEIGDPTPKFNAGLTNTFAWRGVELTGLLQGSYGGKILNVNRIRTESSPRVNVARERWLDAWRPDNPDGKYPRVGENPNQVGPNNFTTNLLEDGSYLRLRSATLSWNVPQRLIARSRASGARVYVTGNNIFTLTDYTGYDPDVSGQSVGNTNRGIDIGVYPTARGVTFGLNFNY